MPTTTRRSGTPDTPGLNNHALPVGLDLILGAVILILVLPAALGPSLEAIRSGSGAEATLILALIILADLTLLLRLRRFRPGGLAILLSLAAAALSRVLEPGWSGPSLALAPPALALLWDLGLRPQLLRRRAARALAILELGPLEQAPAALAELPELLLNQGLDRLRARLPDPQGRALLAEAPPALRLRFELRAEDEPSVDGALALLKDHPELWPHGYEIEAKEAIPGVALRDKILAFLKAGAPALPALALVGIPAVVQGSEDGRLIAARRAIEALDDDDPQVVGLAAELIGSLETADLARALEERPPTAPGPRVFEMLSAAIDLPFLERHRACLRDDDPRLLDAFLNAAVAVLDDEDAALPSGLRDEVAALRERIRAVHPPGDNPLADDLVRRSDALLGRAPPPPDAPGAAGPDA